MTTGPELPAPDDPGPASAVWPRYPQDVQLALVPEPDPCGTPTLY